VIITYELIDRVGMLLFMIFMFGSAIYLILKNPCPYDPNYKDEL
jgi:hypothetical protein